MEDGGLVFNTMDDVNAFLWPTTSTSTTSGPESALATAAGVRSAHLASTRVGSDSSSPRPRTTTRTWSARGGTR